jgi:hypothetical protein
MSSEVISSPSRTSLLEVEQILGFKLILFPLILNPFPLIPSLSIVILGLEDVVVVTDGL